MHCRVKAAFSSLVLLCAVSAVCCQGVGELSHCVQKDSAKSLTALDATDHGAVLWSMPTGPGPMLSSNIHELDLTTNGDWVRIIPSLTGGLYRFNGHKIDQVPITADSLLTSSFKYMDDVVIAGGKEVRTYGVSLASGEQLYECTLLGCSNQTANPTPGEDVILVERTTQTVRAVEPRSGVERWNFSVGIHNVKPWKVECRDGKDPSSLFSNVSIKVVVPDGLISVLNKSDGSNLWQYKLDHPIVSVWTFDGENMEAVDLFVSSPFRWSGHGEQPDLYVGMHEKQLYVHESLKMQRLLASMGSSSASIPSIPWRPFPASDSAVALVNGDLESVEAETSVTALSVLHSSEHVNGNGFYLFSPDALERKDAPLCDSNLSEVIVDGNGVPDAAAPVHVVVVSIYYWWKEVVALLVATAVFISLLNQRLSPRPVDGHRLIVEEVPVRVPVPVPVLVPSRSVSESSDRDFVSRYLNDFEPLFCLGKGGFGVVFEARNKIDRCVYAVKRITLPKQEQSRERVMREVLALAKLEHRNIVRYFNSWVECPPPGWREQQDSMWRQDSEGFSSWSRSHVVDLPEQPLQPATSATSVDLHLHSSQSDASDSLITFERTSSTSSTAAVAAAEDVAAAAAKPPLPANSPVLLYIQMQLCRRDSLHEWLQLHTGERDVRTALSIFQQIVSAVEYVHNQGLIHRDLKPSNIFFSMEGAVKVGDFGLVTDMEADAGGCVPDDAGSCGSCGSARKHTRAVGTHLYMSPEQLKGLPYNYKVDIYSLGVILFELLVPFATAMERARTLSDLRQNRYPPHFLTTYKDEHSLLHSMLSECPEDRPTTLDIRQRPPLRRRS